MLALVGWAAGIVGEPALPVTWGWSRMFRWKKRDDGFEWQKYVRTTIKLRREARKQRAHKLGAQVAEGAKAAGAAADVLARSSARRLGDAARQSAVQLGRMAVAGVSLAGVASGGLARGLGRGLAPAIDVLGRPGVGGPLLFVGLIAAAAGLGRGLLGANGFDTEAVAALGIGIGCMILGLGPTLWLGHAALPRQVLAPVTGLPSRPWLAAGAVGLMGLLGAIGLQLTPWRMPLPSVASLPAMSFTGAAPIAGKATVVAADTLKIGDSRVRMSGIEVPDPDQRCTRPGTRPGRTWACGQEAREATQRLVQGQTVSCEVGGKDSSGLASGRCQAAGADIAEALVKAGHAFSEPGLVPPYRTAEAAARASRSGIWGAADIERPAAWRERIWSTAKRQAPDGCPIKGRVRGDEREYLLPWSSDYARVRVSKRRGERWFCSEAEAVAAGWRSPRKG